MNLTLRVYIGACSSQFASCNGNTYNCPILCYGTFRQGGTPSQTCTNGIIPEWIPFRSCLCDVVGCNGLCPDCANTLPMSTTATTQPSAQCSLCFNSATGSGGPCETEYNTCVANPTSSCALLCAPYFQNNLPLYSGCNTTIPEWPSLGSCLCAQCSSVCTNTDGC